MSLSSSDLQAMLSAITTAFNSEINAAHDLATAAANLTTAQAVANAAQSASDAAKAADTAADVNSKKTVDAASTAIESGSIDDFYKALGIPNPNA